MTEGKRNVPICRDPGFGCRRSVGGRESQKTLEVLTLKGTQVKEMTAFMMPAIF
jgi:hypothetical protein